jgi:hypothetical protein
VFSLSEIDYFYELRKIVKYGEDTRISDEVRLVGNKGINAEKWGTVGDKVWICSKTEEGKTQLMIFNPKTHSLVY